jgi:hypothetical protein
VSSKVKSKGGCRAKGASGERQAANDIMANCPGLKAERNARNGKATSDVLVWEPQTHQGGFHQIQYADGTVSALIPLNHDVATRHLLEVKRVESLDIGTKAMAKIREQATADGAIGVLWRRNRSSWRLDCQWYGSWVTFSGDDVWRQIERLVSQ